MAEPEEIPTYAIRDWIADNLDRAIHEICKPGEGIMWDCTYTVIPTPVGLTNASLLVLIAPSPILGGQSLISSSMADLRQFMLWAPTLTAVRELVDHLRNQRANLLKVTNPPN